MGLQEVHLGRDLPCAVHLLLLGQPGDRRPAGGCVGECCMGKNKKTANWAQATQNGQATVLPKRFRMLRETKLLVAQFLMTVLGPNGIIIAKLFSARL